MPDYETFVFTTEFTESLTKLSPADQRRVFAALRQLDTDEKTSSLQVHQLKGQQAGTWTAYATKKLRITFERLEDGRKRLLEANQHYGD